MPLLTDVRDAACAFLRAALPEAARVEAFFGDLDMDGAGPRNIPFGSDASIFVAVVEAENAGGPLDLDLVCTFGAFSISRHASRPTAACSASLSLAQKAALAIHGSTFGLGGIGPARIENIAPIDSEDLAKAGIRAWSVVWTQTITFAELEADDGLGRP